MMMEHPLQLLLVLTPDWNSIEGCLWRFERNSVSEQFIAIGQSTPFVVGQKGMAWGLGLHCEEPVFGPLKQEGDRKAPAGIFRLGPIFIDQFLIKTSFSMPSVQMDQHWEAIDDPHSIYYNQLLDTRTVTKDWLSSEQMQMNDDDVYRLGLVIHHNFLPTIPGRGSCIFMHRWRTSNQGTYGCTALSAEDLVTVLEWLDPVKFPLLIQLPQQVFQDKKNHWNLLQALCPLEVPF
jgi:D-alanyl-D-alanine dipeptidase